MSKFWLGSIKFGEFRKHPMLQSPGCASRHSTDNTFFQEFRQLYSSRNPNTVTLDDELKLMPPPLTLRDLKAFPSPYKTEFAIPT